MSEKNNSKNSQNTNETKAEKSVATVATENKGKESTKKDDKKENNDKKEKHIAELRESYKKIGALHSNLPTICFTLLIPLKPITLPSFLSIEN